MAVSRNYNGLDYRAVSRASYEETHLITAGMQFSRKAILLRALVTRSDRKDKGAIIKLLNYFQEESKRNVFAHSFARSDEDNVIFVTRDNHGKFVAKEHRFSATEFETHIQQFIEAAKSFEKEVGLTRNDIEAFCAAAMTLTSKS